MNRTSHWRRAVGEILDRVLGGIENREALADVVLDDLQRALERARGWREDLSREADRLRCEVERHRAAERDWRERARKVAAEDETRALERLLRSRRAAGVARMLENRLEEHQRLEVELETDLERLEERHVRLSSQRELIRLRQSSFPARAGARADDAALEEDPAEVFRLWEAQLAELERGGRVAGALEPRPDRSDPEDDESLRAELASLLSDQRIDKEEDG